MMSIKMIFASLITYFLLLQVSVAQPHGRHHRRVQKRAVTTEYVTAVAPEVIVYVDDNGSTVSVETLSPTTTIYPTETAAPTLTATSQTTASPVVETSSTQAASPTTLATQATEGVSTTTSAPVAASSSTTGAMIEDSGVGITYSPYAADGSCKSLDQIQSDFDKISGFNIVRIYGVDCNQVANLLSVAASKNFKLFAGLFDISNLAGDLQTLVSAGNGNWDKIDTVAIGNELVNNGAASVSQVVSALGTARSTLGAAGYTGSIVTVDTFVAMIANPELCTASDYCAANCHAFFDGGVAAANAGAFVAEQAKRVSDAAGGKKTIITESGWPHGGDANGDAIPSVANQQAAIQSLKDSFSSGLFVFTAFDDLWKAPGEFGVEQSWGILGTDS